MVAATSSASEVSGSWTAQALSFEPELSNLAATLLQAAPSANAPCTMMILTGSAGAAGAAASEAATMSEIKTILQEKRGRHIWRSGADGAIHFEEREGHLHAGVQSLCAFSSLSTGQRAGAFGHSSKTVFSSPSDSSRSAYDRAKPQHLGAARHHRSHMREPHPSLCDWYAGNSPI